MLYENMMDVIGNTPLVKLRLNTPSAGSVYAKLELMNPFGMKDRVAKQTILAAKSSGELKDDMPIIESSSGTMACGVALVGRQLGHPVHIVTDPRIDSITYAKLVSLGCQVHVVKEMGKHGWQSARLERLHELMEEYPGAFWPRQYENPENPRAYQELATELMDDLERIDILVGSVGSGGSLSGSARALKQVHSDLKVVAVDATGSVIFGQPDRPARLQGGLGNSLIAPNVDFSVIDDVHWLNDEEAFAATLQLAHNEHIFAGNSSGSVYAVARWLAGQVSQDCNIVAIFPDRGDRYTDTIYSEQYRKHHGLSALRFSEEPQRVELDCEVSSWSYTTLMGVHPLEEKTAIR
ncbi:PLP-dependent cysteine synthase family protein [Kroppenstedtia eburnea]|uniref:Cysteine synthase A n=1 Tax=Kroppenstedtia eburnea TaxID=714067 RepID=A0A1N7LXL7_9BACL|nr:cysteine synthase family protein [Kroppenstedtia eburnea]QKI81698.1 cysteine synthase family protein [Kroppenstedtia eburnea]SIS78554.1 cysteine synthase A [Kroppenstedtia eburnea]